MPNLIEKSSYATLHSGLFQLYQDTLKPNADEEKIRSSFKDLLQHDLRNNENRNGALLDRYHHLIELSFSKQKTQDTAASNQSFRRRPVVLTTINPFGRKDLQLRCFKRWQELGFEVYSCNYGSEIAPLIEMGMNPKDIIQLGIHETGQDMHGKPIPRVASVLHRAYAGFDQDLLLVNSDLYVAAQDDSFLDVWRQTGEVLAITRQDVFSLDYPISRLSNPYRGGLDAFLIPRRSMRQLLDAIALFHVSHRMCFGIVGWDYFIGAILKTRLQGKILDSQVLFHEIHTPTYSNINEFSHYTTAMQAMGVGLGLDHTGIGIEFASVIDAQCRQNTSEDLSAPLFMNENAPLLTDAALLIFEQIEQQAPQLVHAFGYNYVASVIGGINQHKDVRFTEVMAQIRDSELKRSFGHILMLCVIFLSLRPHNLGKITENYPQHNQHSVAIKMIIQNTLDQPDLQRFEVAKLFCTELVDYHIFNRRLFNALAMSCENNAERSLLSQIRDIIVRKEPDAT